MKDKIVEEIHKHRQEFASKFDYDVRKMLEYVRKEQEKSGRKVVSFAKEKTEDKDGKKAA